MYVKKKFRRSCPSCRGKDKIIKRCKKCFAYVCSDCGIGGLCHNCFINAHVKDEIITYMEEKFENYSHPILNIRQVEVLK